MSTQRRPHCKPMRKAKGMRKDWRVRVQISEHVPSADRLADACMRLCALGAEPSQSHALAASRDYLLNHTKAMSHEQHQQAQ